MFLIEFCLFDVAQLVFFDHQTFNKNDSTVKLNKKILNISILPIILLTLNSINFFKKDGYKIQ